jgi:hypothetical protein
MKSESEFVRQAHEDYAKKSGVYNNPYLLASPAYNAYERGWMQALKRDGGKSVNFASPSLPSTHAQPTGVNLYAELKGRSGPRR